jgi:hypothetical protein
MIVRRVVTGHRSGKSVIVSDGKPARSHDFVHLPGMSTALVWMTHSQPAVPSERPDAVTATTSFLPGTGETRLIFVTFPPDSVSSSSGFDGAAAGREYMEQVPDIASKFEPGNPGMHVTDTVDYAIVLEGEVWLELDDGAQHHLEAHDVLIQNGTRHAWRNKTNRPVKMVFVMIGAQRRTA